KNETYDLIIGNPPYIRYQYLTEPQREMQSAILASNGMKSNKLINAWVAFLVACVTMLSEKGIIAFVIPAELLQVAYAEDLRIFLTEHLDDITVVTFKELVFSEVQQETVVFYGKRGCGNKKIRIVEVNDTQDFEELSLDIVPYMHIVNKKDKWTKYFVSESETRILDLIRSDKRFRCFHEYGIINVGITTGNNKYFSITKKTENEYGLSEAVLPLIGRSSHVHGIYFTKEDWLDNCNNGKRAMLIRFPDIPYKEYPEGYKRYIKAGEQNEENKGYKCRIRDRWYIVPSVWVPDAFFLRRNHLYPKFVLNRCGAVSTDTMHRMKLNDGVDGEDVLLAYYNSISFAFTEVCGRSYGGGVLEILPGEMGNIRIPDISEVDKGTKQRLLKSVDRFIREDRNIEEVLDLVDRELLEECLEIPADWCQECRRIWKTLQQRRLNRAVPKT
ncbi:MAG: class I SAM-dependent methyltransferase, partial [Oribacterium sp.]|nr:class I SAM-dependent methyltransferase [Oribacterium sp.]